MDTKEELLKNFTLLCEKCGYKPKINYIEFNEEIMCITMYNFNNKYVYKVETEKDTTYKDCIPAILLKIPNN